MGATWPAGGPLEHPDPGTPATPRQAAAELRGERTSLCTWRCALRCCQVPAGAAHSCMLCWLQAGGGPGVAGLGGWAGVLYKGHSTPDKQQPGSRCRCFCCSRCCCWCWWAGALLPRVHAQPGAGRAAAACYHCCHITHTLSTWAAAACLLSIFIHASPTPAAGPAAAVCVLAPGQQHPPLPV